MYYFCVRQCSKKKGSKEKLFPPRYKLLMTSLAMTFSDLFAYSFLSWNTFQTFLFSMAHILNFQLPWQNEFADHFSLIFGLRNYILITGGKKSYACFFPIAVRSVGLRKKRREIWKNVLLPRILWFMPFFRKTKHLFFLQILQEKSWNQYFPFIINDKSTVNPIFFFFIPFFGGQASVTSDNIKKEKAAIQPLLLYARGLQGQHWWTMDKKARKMQLMQFYRIFCREWAIFLKVRYEGNFGRIGSLVIARLINKL